MFRRILVGVDDSKQSREALDRAIELVDAANGRLGLLSSAPTPTLVCTTTIVTPVHPAQLERELIEWAQNNVDAAERLVPERIPVTKHVTRGSPVPALLRAAESGCWDLIVVGESNRRRLPFRRSTGDLLNRGSDTPVLVVHEDGADPRAGRARAGWWRRRRTRARRAPTAAV